MRVRGSQCCRCVRARKAYLRGGSRHWGGLRGKRRGVGSREHDCKAHSSCGYGQHIGSRVGHGGKERVGMGEGRRGLGYIYVLWGD
jgi:hypothetical protein